MGRTRKNVTVGNENDEEIEAVANSCSRDGQADVVEPVQRERGWCCEDNVKWMMTHWWRWTNLTNPFPHRQVEKKLRKIPGSGPGTLQHVDGTIIPAQPIMTKDPMITPSDFVSERKLSAMIWV